MADFSENVSFVVQDEIQSFHWNNSSATIHPKSHGKSAGDGAGGTVKRVATKTCLQHPYGNHILTVLHLYKFAVGHIQGMWSHPGNALWLCNSART